MANDRKKHRAQDLRAYLRSQGVSAPPSRHEDVEHRVDHRAESRYAARRAHIPDEHQLRRRRWIGVILLGQAMLLVGLTLYIRGPVNRMTGSVAEYAGAGVAEMVNTSFVNYGYVVDLPPFSLDKPFEARYHLGLLPWTDKAVYVCLVTDRAMARTEAFDQGRLEIRVLQDGAAVSSAEGRLEQWTLGRGDTMLFHANAFELDAALIQRPTPIVLELKYEPGPRIFTDANASVNILSGGAR